MAVRLYGDVDKQELAAEAKRFALKRVERLNLKPGVYLYYEACEYLQDQYGMHHSEASQLIRDTTLATLQEAV